MDKDTNKNLILALVLSLAVLIGWQVFYGLPKMKEKQAQIEAQQKAAGGKVVAPPGQENQPAPAAPQTSDSALPGVAPSPVQQEVDRTAGRVEIDTISLAGSINLQGGRIDDLKLIKYHEEVDTSSPVVTLLSPVGTANPYYVDTGWVTGAGSTAKLPDGNTIWRVDGNPKLTSDSPVTLTWDNGAGLEFRRIISVDENYLFAISQEVENTTGGDVTLSPYAQVTRNGTPQTAGFFVLHEGPIGFLADELQEVDYSDLQESSVPVKIDSNGGWLGITDKYWAVVLMPDQDRDLHARFGDYKVGSQDVYRTDYVDAKGLTVRAGSKATSQSHLFAGAKEVSLIDSYGEQTKVSNFDLLIDWGWFYFITKPMFHLLQYFKDLTGNFGIAILLATVVIKIFFFPLANKSYVSMSRMKKLQPEMVKIKERFPDDKMKQQEAMMAMYKKEKVSPVSGCLPVVIQIPVFFALYKVLFVTIAMRHAPFFGWIQDLSAPDPTSMFNLFGLIPVDLPQFMMIGVWPLIMGFTMFIQMKLNPAPPDPIQAKIFTWMPVFFTFLLASFPAGLVIYWAWNNTLSVLQQYTIMRRQGVDIELMKNIKETFGLGKPKAKDES